MVIWFISKYASPPKYSKMPSRLFHLAREIQSIGHEVVYITSDSNHFSAFPISEKIYNKEIIDNIFIVWIKTYKYIKTASLKRLISWFDFEYKLFRLRTNNLTKPDVIHVSSLSIFTVVYGYYLKMKFKAKLVFEIRDIWPLTMIEEGGFKTWHPLVKFIGWIEKFGYKKADLVLGTMPNLGAHIENVLGYSRPFYCLPLGFNPNDYDDQSILINNPFSYLKNSDKMIVGYAGSMGITNALESLVETIKLLSNNYKIHFLLVGSGDLKSKFEMELKGFDNVTFLDRVEQNNVKYILAICDVLYLSSQKSKVWDYGQSMNKVVEYMLASKPIIATYSGYPSMIDEANCGYYIDQNSVELSEKIEHLASLSKVELEIIGKKGRTWVFEHRRYPTLAANYINKLNEIL